MVAGDEMLPGPVEVRIFIAFRHDQLPEQLAGALGEAHQHAAIALVLGVARLLVVRADIDASPRDDRRGISLGAQIGNPLHVAPRRRVERVRKPVSL